MNEPAVLSIGTTHPWNIAGVGLDTAIACEYHVHPYTAVAAVSVQGVRGVEALQPLSSYMLDAQLAAMPWERVGSIRIGALATGANVRVAVTHLRAHPQVLAVVDPVLSASNGGALVDAASIIVLRDELGTLPNVILTPNLDEAATLLESARVDRESMAQSAQTLRARGAYAVLLTGGHLSGDPCDVLAVAEGVQAFRGSRIPTEMRGTGCTLAMALACELARGSSLDEAVLGARAFVRAKIEAHAKRTTGA